MDAYTYMYMYMYHHSCNDIKAAGKLNILMIDTGLGEIPGVPMQNFRIKLDYSLELGIQYEHLIFSP